MIRRIINAAASSLGYSIQRERRNGVGPPSEELPADFTVEDREIWRSVAPYTMTSKERVVSLVRAVQYIERYKIPGAVVECGVWKGGSMMAVAKTLLAHGWTDRELFLFDTYSGMPEASSVDVDGSDRSAAALLGELRVRPVEEQKQSDIAALCPLEIVQTNLASTGYPMDRIRFIEGKVEDTIPQHAPSSIALLRLDTDWYESTRHELVHLFPRLSHGGILVIDDYGHWRGARLAADEYFEQNGQPIFLSRIDYTGRIAVRC
jgi:hypothetical protein